MPVLCASPPISTLRMCREAPKFGCKSKLTVDAYENTL